MHPLRQFPILRHALVRLALLGVLVVLSPARGAAAETGPLDLADWTVPTFTTFSVRDGMPGSVISSVRVDRDGFVWAALPEGLVRWDGRHWLQADPFTIHGQLGQLLLSHDGSLWVAFQDRGVHRFDGERWAAVEGAPDGYLYRLTETVDHRGQPSRWALTSNTGAELQSAEGWSAIDAWGASLRVPLSLAVTHRLGAEDRLWAGIRGEGLFYRDPGDREWQPFEAPGLDGSVIVDLLVTGTGDEEQLWIATNGAGLWRLDGAGLKSWTAAAGDLPSDTLYRLAASTGPEGRPVVWAGARGGLLRVHNDRVRSFDHRDGLPAATVRDLDVWSDGEGVQVLWIATDNGVARTVLSGDPWRRVSLPGAATGSVFAVLVEADGKGGERLWTGARDDGLVLLEDGQWRHFRRADGLPGGTVRMIRRIRAADGSDTLWIGTSSGGLARLAANGKLHLVEGPWAKTPEEAVVALVERVVDGRMERWIGTRLSGLYRWRDGEWKSMRTPEQQAPLWSVWQIVEQIDAAGTSWLWAATSHGLVRVSADQVEVYRHQLPGMPPGGYHGLTLVEEVGRARLWVGTDRGVLRLDVTDPEHPEVLANELPPPPDPLIYTAQRDPQGRMWLCTHNGVQLLTPDAGGWASRVFTRRDGLPHDECNSNGQFVDTYGRYWAGTLGGLGIFDPAIDRPDRDAKPFRLTAVRIGAEDVAPDRIVLPPGAGALQVDFALLSWRDEDRSEFRSQLVGVERAATTWSGRNTREFLNLPPGRFVLRAEARDYAGNESPPIELSVEVLPAWWQTALARWLAVLALLGLVYLLFRWRLRALTTRQDQLEQEVAARTRELHAANARLRMLSQRDPLTSLANRRGFHKMLVTAIRDARQPHALLFVDVDHFKAYNDRFGHPAGDEALKVVAAAILRCVPEGRPAARYGGEEFTCLLPGTPLAEAQALAESLRTAVEIAAVPVPGSKRINHITISVGVAVRELLEEADADHLMREADQAMYRAKAAGRNCVRD